MRTENERARLLSQMDKITSSISVNIDLNTTEKDKMKEFIERSTKADIEYLFQDPDNYFDMYINE